MEFLCKESSGAVAYRLTSEEVDELVQLFATIASQENWRPGDDLLRYQDRSVYLAGASGDSIIGGIQLVLGDGQQPLPFTLTWPEICCPSNPRVGHVLILALDKGHRGGLGFFGLLSLCLWRECKIRGIEELWLEATPAKLKVYRRLGWPLNVRGELREHWGEPCVLCSLSVAEAEAGVRARSYWQEIVALADQEFECLRANRIDG